MDFGMHAPPGKINYSWRITIILFTTEHLLEIFETRKMYPLGISLLTFMQLSAAYVVGQRFPKSGEGRGGGGVADEVLPV